MLSIITVNVGENTPAQNAATYGSTKSLVFSGHKVIFINRETILFSLSDR